MQNSAWCGLSATVVIIIIFIVVNVEELNSDLSKSHFPSPSSEPSDHEYGCLLHRGISRVRGGPGYCGLRLAHVGPCSYHLAVSDHHKTDRGPRA